VSGSAFSLRIHANQHIIVHTIYYMTYAFQPKVRATEKADGGMDARLKADTHCSPIFEV